MSLIQALDLAFTKTQDPDQLAREVGNQGWIPVLGLKPCDWEQFSKEHFVIAWAYPDNRESSWPRFMRGYLWQNEAAFGHFLSLHQQGPEKYFLMRQLDFDKSRTPLPEYY
jgi:hypothetical protein